jgi:phage terminase large subunit-like protein
MAKKKDEEPPDKKAMLEFLSGAFKRQAHEPNMHGYVPHNKQTMFHTSAKKARLYIGGNRSGKSVGGVVEDLWWVTGRHPHRQIPDKTIRGRVIGVDFINGIQGILLPIFKRWIVPSDLQGGSWEQSWNNAERKLTLENGNELDFKSYDQDLDKHAGTSRDFVHFDEEPPKSIFIENLVRLIDTGGSWWITMTPVEGMTWVYKELYEPWFQGKRHDIDVIKVDMSDNPYLSPEEKLGLLAFLGDDDREKREHGTFVPRGGLVFPQFQESVHATLHGWRPPSDWLVYHSLDHGFNNPTASLHHAVSPNGQSVVTFHEHYKRETIVEQHAKEILEWEQLFGVEPFLRTGDPAMKQRQAQSGNSIQTLYAELGIYFALDSVPRDVNVGVDKMTQYLQVNPVTGRPFWQISDCPNLTREMRQLHWDYYISGKLEDSNNVKETIHKVDDHAPDAARYFFTFLPDLSPIGMNITQKEPDPSVGIPVGTIWDMLNNHSGTFRGGEPTDSDWAVVAGFSKFADSWEDDYV